MQGWIKLHRKVLDHELWNDVSTFRLFTLFLLKAAHEDGVKMNGIELKKGQYIRSYRKLADDLAYKDGRGLKRYSTGTIKRCFAKLIDSGMVLTDETKVGTLITVVNYVSYQHADPIKRETRNESVNESKTNGKRTENNNKNVRMKEVCSHTRARIFRLYENHFGMPSVLESDKIHSWIDEVGEDLMIKAMGIAYKQKKLFWGFVEGILKNWTAKGHKTIFDLEINECKGYSKKPKDNVERLYEHAKKNGVTLKEWA